MGRRSLIIALLLLFSNLAFAQTSSNFVTGQVPSAAQWNNLFSSKQDYSALGHVTSSGTFTTNLTGLSQAFNTLQNATGTVSGATNLNLLLINSDAINAGTNFVNGVAIVDGIGGPTVQGGRQVLQVLGSLNAATNAANGNRFYVGATIGMQAQASDGGGSGTEKGRLFALNPYVLLTSVATNFSEASISEFNTRLQAGSSSLLKYGIKIVQVSDDAVSGSTQDAALFFGNQVGAIGWGTLIQIGDGTFQTPLKTAGSILAIKGSPTFTHGLDLSGGTCSTDCFKSTGFLVSGSGALTATLPTSAGGGGVYVCVDTAGVMYKKSSCP